MISAGFVVIALGVIAFTLISKRLETTVVTPAIVFTCFGLLIGEAGLGIVDLRFDHTFVHTLAEITLVLVLFSDAARIELAGLKTDHILPFRMLVLGMPFVIVFGTLMALALPLGLGIWGAALLAAVLAPTDAALGQFVVTSPLVPQRIRQALNVESGLNDGVALPIIVLCVGFVGMTVTGDEIDDWGWITFQQLTLGPLVGALVGGAGAWAIDRASIKGWMSGAFQGAAILGVALLSYVGADVVGGNGFIAAFVCGAVFGNAVRGRCAFIFEFAEAEGQILVLGTFLIFGASILPEVAPHIEAVHIVYALLSLAVLRPVAIGLSLIGCKLELPTILFLGWFGPRGLASLLFALFVVAELDVPETETILAIAVVTVAISVFVHGLSAAPWADWYGKRMAALGRCEEKKTVPEMPLRV